MQGEWGKEYGELFISLSGSENVDKNSSDIR